MTRLTFLLATLFALAGCESEFQVCMNTELPRAEKLLGVSEAKDFFMELNFVQKEVDKQLPFEQEYLEWTKQNPAPERPEEVDQSDWELSDEYKAHSSRAEAYEIDNLTRAGFQGSSLQRLAESYDLYFNGSTQL